MQRVSDLLNFQLVETFKYAYSVNGRNIKFDRVKLMTSQQGQQGGRYTRIASFDQ